MSRFEKLSNTEFSDNKQLEEFCRELQEICRELFAEVYFASEILYQNLATLTDENAKRKARRVSNNVKRMSDFFHAAGGLSVKTWRDFQATYQEQLDEVRGVKKPKQSFKFRG